MQYDVTYKLYSDNKQEGKLYLAVVKPQYWLKEIKPINFKMDTLVAS